MCTSSFSILHIHVDGEIQNYVEIQVNNKYLCITCVHTAIRHSTGSNTIQCFIEVIRFEIDAEPKMCRESCLTNLTSCRYTHFLLLGTFCFLSLVLGDPFVAGVNIIFELQMKAMGLCFQQ